MIMSGNSWLLVDNNGIIAMAEDKNELVAFNLEHGYYGLSKIYSGEEFNTVLRSLYKKKVDLQ